jgi:hypothetical protein
MNDTTPGQVCYEAFWPSACVPWFTLAPHWHAAWEAAAQAVLTQALADRVWAQQEASSRRQEGTREEERDG